MCVFDLFLSTQSSLLPIATNHSIHPNVASDLAAFPFSMFVLTGQPVEDSRP